MDKSLIENEELPYDFENHWNNAYHKTLVNNLGWYEENPKPSLELITECELPKDALIFNAGAGATTLIEQLIARGFTNIVINDIAASALAELKNDLPNHKNSNLQFIVDDLTNPTELLRLNDIDLWHDRAVLHFFTAKAQREAYFILLKKLVKIGGFVILAEFNLKGAKKCCGLDVINFDTNMLQECLGDGFELLRSFDYTYIQPSGDERAYVYTLFQRTV